jgi:hypothetical protein
MCVLQVERIWAHVFMLHVFLLHGVPDSRACDATVLGSPRFEELKIY